jgi:hypothetical protein
LLGPSGEKKPIVFVVNEAPKRKIYVIALIYQSLDSEEFLLTVVAGVEETKLLSSQTILGLLMPSLLRPLRLLWGGGGAGTSCA